MERIISCCGLNCASCDARIATMKNDDKLRNATADKWRIEFKASEIVPEMINCTGCREEGVKFSHCSLCEIRKCADLKGFRTCAECNELETCSIVATVHKFVPEARANLLSLN